jgi:nicotinamide-nucleotide amidase
MKERILTSFGLKESAAWDLLEDLKSKFPQIRAEVKHNFPEIQLRLSSGHTPGNKTDDLLREALDWSRKQMGAYFLSAEGESLEAVVGCLLRELQLTVSVAESCTGGLISHMLTNVSGSSDYFLMAGVTYANQAKKKLLGVSEETLRRCGAVHERTAEEMAVGIRNLSGADYALATTGIAGPTGGSREKPVGTLCVGLAGSSGVESRRFRFSFPERLKNKKIFAATALDMLRKRLLRRLTDPVRDDGPCARKPGSAGT